jgi:hypothetical protein
MKLNFSSGITLACGQYEPALKLNFHGAVSQFQQLYATHISKQDLL